MTEELKKTIKEELASLPKEWQTAIGSIDWLPIAEQIGAKYSLEEGELEDFQLETLLVLIGATDAEYYAVNIENHVNTTKEQSEQMAKEGLEKILIPIRKNFEEQIKKNISDKKTTWKQSIDFILSGGDYAALIEEPEIEKAVITFNTPPKKPNMDDIRSKFVI